MKTYFVTGASGVIGSALIPLLLQDNDTCVELLLRANSTEELHERLEMLCRFWQIAETDTALRERIRAIRGDIGLPAFGLEQQTYHALSMECTHLIHCAGNVRMNLPIEQARLYAVDSVRHIIALGRRCPRLEKIEFVSTVGVAGRMPGLLPERWIETRIFHNTYEQAKFEAEELIRLEAQGLPFTIHRPSMVVGNAVTGRIIHFQVFYHLCEFLSGRRTRGLYPDFGSATLDMVPVDYVAAVIAWSSRTSRSCGQILHSCSGPELAIPIARLRAQIRCAFASEVLLPGIISLPPGIFRILLSGITLLTSEKNRRALKPLSVFLDYLANTQRFSNRDTLSLLAKDGPTLQPPAHYLNQVLRYYLRSASSRK